jgi:amino acid adenylation domain-containing protein/thioester reductase-like protein
MSNNPSIAKERQAVSAPFVPVHAAFEYWARLHPHRIALVEGEPSGNPARISYAELNTRADRLSRALRRAGAGRNSIVALFLESSGEAVAAILATLKCGAAYLPIDTASPPARVNAIVAQSKPICIVTNREKSKQLRLEEWASSIGKPIQIIVEDDPARVDCEDSPMATSDAIDVMPQDAAYVIYTSGSSGSPKGVVIEHGALSHYVESASALYGIDQNDRVLQFCSLAFDVSIEEIFCAYWRGATLVVRDHEAPNSATAFLALCARQAITCASLPTSFWHLLAEHMSRSMLCMTQSMRLIVIGGERVMPERLANWVASASDEIRLVNAYGPTETTISVTHCDIAGPRAPAAADTVSEVSIGKPLPGVFVRVLDPSMREVDCGEVGELYVGGACLGRGYLDEPQLTAKAFVDLEDVTGNTVRMYRTGDRVRRGGDGALHFVGRLDGQVKVGSYRVDVFEVECALSSSSSVAAAAVVATAEEGGSKRLIAYIVPSRVTDGDETETSLRDHLRREVDTALPAYMQPSTYVFLKSLPYSTAGKVDYSALPKPSIPADCIDGPWTSIEEEGVAKIWRELLHADHFTREDSFIDLGGTSMRIAEMIVRAEHIFNVNLSVKRFLESPTIASLAKDIVASRTGPVGNAHGLVDIESESVFDIPLNVPKSTTQAARVGDVLLTGVTGFLGAFLLPELLARTDGAIHCLVRCEDANCGMQRIVAKLDQYGIAIGCGLERIRVIPGDLSKIRFGLSAVEFEALAARIGSIMHSGAAVDYVKPYSALKPSNVTGTREVLRLAAMRPGMVVNHVSTLGAFGAIGWFHNVDVVGEQISINASRDFILIDDGYAISKWVAESMVANAAAKGIPARILRPGFIFGHSRSGAHNPTDFLSRLLEGCLKMRAYPQLYGYKEHLLTVDYAAQAIAHLSYSKPPPAFGSIQAFNITPSPGTDLKVVDLFRKFSAMGYDLEELSYSGWCDRLRRDSRLGLGNPITPLLPLFVEKIHDDRYSLIELYMRSPDYTCDSTLLELAGSGIELPSLDTVAERVWLPRFFQRANQFSQPTGRNTCRFSSQRPSAAVV